MTMIMRKFSSSVFAFVMVGSICLLSASAEDQCSSGRLFDCPNCGGKEVSDCFDCDGYLSTDLSHGICFDRRLFARRNTDDTDYDNHYHHLMYDLIGAVVWFIVAGFSTAGGIGGGGLYVPLGILLLQFSPKQSSGLSQAAIFGAALGALLLNLNTRHPATKIRSVPGIPDPDHDGSRTIMAPFKADELQKYTGKFYTRPVIDYDLTLFLSPMILSGAVLGVMVQKILPNWAYLMIATLVLALTAHKTYQKYLQMNRKERAEKQKQAEADAQLEKEDDPVDVTPTPDDDEYLGYDCEDKDQEIANATSVESTSVDAAQQLDSDQTTNGTMVPLSSKQPQPEVLLQSDELTHERIRYLEEDMRQFPAEKIAALGVLFVGLLVLTLLLGGKGFESLIGIDCQSPWYAVLVAIQFFWMFGFAVVCGIRIVKRQQARVRVSYPYLADDVQWNYSVLRFFGGCTFLSGVIAGLIGVGGGMILGPLMLFMGINPMVSTTTNNTVVVLTSASVAFIHVISGLVPWSYAVFFFFICFMGAIVGKIKIDGYIKRTGRSSLLIAILAANIALATIGCVVILLTGLAEKDWCFDGFKKFCNVHVDADCPVDRFLLGNWEELLKITVNTAAATNP